MFLFFNLIFVIMKLRSITSPFPPKTLNSGCSNMSKGNNSQYQINYRQCVINPFLNIFFRNRTRNHTTSFVQESEHNHKNSYCKSDSQSVDSVIPKILDHPSEDEASIHVDNISQDKDTNNHNGTLPLSEYLTEKTK